MAPWSKHLDTNSECPEKKSDTITIFNMRFCPFAQRAILVSNAKNIQYDLIHINLSKKPKWFLEKNPLGKVPTIQIGDDIIYESLPVCDFLDSNFPGIQLNPLTPLERAKDKMILARYDSTIGLYYKLLFSKTDRVDISNQLRDSLKIFETEMNQRGTKYFNGNDRPGMLDYMIWPWIERINVFPRLFTEVSEIIPKNDFPKFNIWIENMVSDAAVEAYFLETEKHLNFYMGYKDGNADYDPQ